MSPCTQLCYQQLHYLLHTTADLSNVPKGQAHEALGAEVGQQTVGPCLSRA